MDDRTPHASGLCLCHEFKPTVHNAGPRAKRLLDSTEQVQALQSAKKACVLSHHCSTPDPSEKLLLCSPDSACFQGSSLDDTGHDDLVASSSASKYNDVVISLDTTRCFDDSEPNDSLLELSDREEGNSPFSYTEEEIQEILADDCVESEWYLTRKSTLSQNVNGESEKDKSSSCTGASVISKDVNESSENAEKPNVRLSSECSSVSSECYPSLLNERSVSLDENHLQSAQVTRMLFDLDIQELLSLSPIDADYVDQPLEDDCLEGAKREASEAIINYCLEYDKTVGSCVLEETSEGLMSNGWQSLGVDCLGKTPFTSRDVSNFCGDHVEGSMSSSDLACGQSAADESSAPVLLRCPTPSSGSKTEELSKATKSCFLRKLDSPEDDEGESTEAEQPSNSIKLSDTAVGQIGQEETTSGKKPGKVIPVPQEEERLNQGTCILEAELKQKKHLFPECVHPYQENCSSYTRQPSDGMRNYPRSNKKPTQRYSLTQWVSKNLAKHHYFQSILDRFQHSPVTAFSEV